MRHHWLRKIMDVHWQNTLFRLYWLEGKLSDKDKTLQSDRNKIQLRPLATRVLFTDIASISRLDYVGTNFLTLNISCSCGLLKRTWVSTFAMHTVYKLANKQIKQHTLNHSSSCMHNNYQCILSITTISVAVRLAPWWFSICLVVWVLSNGQINNNDERLIGWGSFSQFHSSPDWDLCFWTHLQIELM